MPSNLARILSTSCKWLHFFVVVSVVTAVVVNVVGGVVVVTGYTIVVVAVQPFQNHLNIM